MSKKPFIRQPNHISTARFNFSLTVLEKNIIYTIVDQLQKVTSKDINQVYSEQHLSIELKSLDKNRNYSRIKNAIKKLGSKHVEFQFVIPKTGKVNGFSTSLISGVRHQENSQFIILNIPEDACRFFCYIGGGFTALQKTIALSLNSIYSKYLYELCCRWEDRGGYTCTIVELKNYLSIHSTYKQITHFRDRVLEHSKKELKEKADVFFEYKLTKTGRIYTKISFKFLRNSQVENKFHGIRGDYFIYIYNFLCRFFPNYIDNKASVLCDEISLKGYIDKAYHRFTKLDDELSQNIKTHQDVRNILIKSILPEMNIIVNHT